MSRLLTKPTKWHVRPAKTQISLGICPVWSQSLLSAWRKLGSLATHWANSKDSDQTGLMPRLIWVFAGRTCHFVGFVTRWFNYNYQSRLQVRLLRLYTNSEVKETKVWSRWYMDYRNEFYFCGFYRCVNSGESLTIWVKPKGLYVRL